MSVKEELLSLLEENRGLDLSGQEIAGRLNVSRSAVWKAVNQLKGEGYQIQSVTKRGYRLLDASDVLSMPGIQMYLDEKYKNLEIVVLKQTDSTNQQVKRRALEGAEEGLVILAEEQTAGKGRRGRSFYSPQGTGIYLSVLFRPNAEKAKNVVLVTTAASVAICRGIRQVLGEEPQIKWVNDIYLRDKKVCGILTEAVSDFETGQIDTVVVGIGINYKEPEEGFPEEIREIAGSICEKGKEVPRNQLVAAILNELFLLYEQLEEKAFIEDYRKWSNVIGKQVRFALGGSGENPTDWQEAEAYGIDSDGGLMVRLPNGEERVLRTGEITLRWK